MANGAPEDVEQVSSPSRPSAGLGGGREPAARDGAQGGPGAATIGANHIDKECTPNPVQVGEQLTCTIDVVAAPGTQGTAAVTDTLPALA